MTLSSQELDAKYRQLGFKPAALGLGLVIGDFTLGSVLVSLEQHPWASEIKDLN